jgi:hypothetical protein
METLKLQVSTTRTGFTVEVESRFVLDKASVEAML